MSAEVSKGINFSSEETAALLDGLALHKRELASGYVRGQVGGAPGRGKRKTRKEAIPHKERAQAWEDITARVNMISTEERFPFQLRHRWKNLRQRAYKDFYHELSSEQNKEDDHYTRGEFTDRVIEILGKDRMEANSYVLTGKKRRLNLEPQPVVSTSHNCLSHLPDGRYLVTKPDLAVMGTVAKTHSSTTPRTVSREPQPATTTLTRQTRSFPRQNVQMTSTSRGLPTTSVASPHTVLSSVLPQSHEQPSPHMTTDAVVKKVTIYQEVDDNMAADVVIKEEQSFPEVDEGISSSVTPNADTVDCVQGSGINQMGETSTTEAVMMINRSGETSTTEAVMVNNISGETSSAEPVRKRAQVIGTSARRFPVLTSHKRTIPGVRSGSTGMLSSGLSTGSMMGRRFPRLIGQVQDKNLVSAETERALAEARLAREQTKLVMLKQQEAKLQIMLLEARLQESGVGDGMVAEVDGGVIDDDDDDDDYF